MKTRDLVTMSLLVAAGFVIHTILPGFFFGMKPDVQLLTMFLGIMFFPKRKNVLVLGILSGMIAALTTNFPGGQIPNIIDKLITSFVFFGMFSLFVKDMKEQWRVGLAVFVGTISSGLVFLSTALVLVGLPVSFNALFVAVVVPTAIMNTLIICTFMLTILTVKEKLDK